MSVSKISSRSEVFEKNIAFLLRTQRLNILLWAITAHPAPSASTRRGLSHPPYVHEYTFYNNILGQQL